MRYEGKLYRPPSEAHSYIVQATIGCSHNLCTYCDMYRDKQFRVRDLDEVLEDIAEAGRRMPWTEKVFVADGDALIMEVERWLTILAACDQAFPRLRRVSCYATAENVLEKTADELRALSAAKLGMLYIGPESGDDVTLKRIVKGSSFQDHVDAAGLEPSEAGIDLSVIVLLGRRRRGPKHRARGGHGAVDHGDGPEVRRSAHIDGDPRYPAGPDGREGTLRTPRGPPAPGGDANDRGTR